MDLENFKEMIPDEYEQLKNFFTVTKTLSKLSAIALDQAHEQNNAKIKDIKGGPVLSCVGFPLVFMTKGKNVSKPKVRSTRPFQGIQCEP